MYRIKLSPYSKIFYTEWLLDPSGQYNLSIDQTLYGKLEISRLKKALKKYVAEHLILNSHIQNIDGEPCWVKNDNINELEYLDNSVVDSSDLSNYINRGFDLHNEPLYRFKLLRIGDNVYRFVIVMHHLVMDGSSSLDPGVFEAISSYYNDENYTIKYSLDEQANLITNLTNILTTQLEQNRVQYKEFWKKRLSGVGSVDLKFLKLSENCNHKSEVATDSWESIDAIEFGYGAVEVDALAQIKYKYSISPYGYSQCILALLLHKYTGQENLAISYPITIKEGIDFIYGAQINTNLIPYQFDNNITIVDLFEQNRSFLKLTLRNNVKYGYYPISNIIQESNKHLLNVCFDQTFFRNKPFAFTGIKEVEISDRFNLDNVKKDSLLFEQNPRGNKLHYRVIFNKKFINARLLNGFVDNYKKLFSEVLEDLSINNKKHISNYSLLDHQQYNKIVCEFNHAEKDYPQDKTIHALFEEQVFRAPDNIAVIHEDIKLTYQELNQKSNQLAHYLLNQHKIKVDDLVVLCLDRSELMLIAILGVLKAGGAYVPIDPKLPDERISYILNDTKTSVILTNTSCQGRLQQIVHQKTKKSAKKEPLSKLAIVALDDDKILASLLPQKQSNPNALTTSNNLVHVLYTSGTAGQPKGVMLEHVGCVNRILEMISTGRMVGAEKVLFKTNYMFDVSFSDIFTALLTGASLIVTKHVFDIDEIKANFDKYSIDICHFTPSQFEAIKSIKDLGLFKRVKVLNFSGEALYPRLLDNIDKNILCANYYGPTEAGEVTFKNTKLTATHRNISDIGKALHNIKLFVLDKDMNPLPEGAIGELYIGGVCLARGYLNNPQLTNLKFIANPFQTAQEKSLKVNNRLYKTGDLVRWLPGGNIEYVGRNDSQVKIRGHRVELGEIESRLLKFGQIKQVVLIVSGDDGDKRDLIGSKYLVAYYVADRKLNEKDLYNYLSLYLPEHMMPNAIVYIDQLPLTPNGKVDKVALPKVQLEQKYIAPTGGLQNKIVSAWSEVLRLPKNKIGIKDSFFRLGGTSISIIKLQYELTKIPELKNIKVVDLFKYTTIEQLTEVVGHTATDKILDYSISKNKDIGFDVAIIAMSGAFSGCNNLAEYWELIKDGKEGLKHATTEELRQNGTPEEVLQNPNFVPRSGHVPHTDQFDPDFWGITKNEAKNMDPQIREFLEHCWYVLETSGYSTKRDRIKIGVFAGGGDSVYVQTFTRQPLIISGIGNLNIKDSLATRVSYLLGLIGPANNINTACSTGLVTVIEACKSLVGNYCDMAIAGGSALLLPEEAGYIYQEGMIFSPDGYCRAFDRQAAGTVHGSGVGVFLLKRLSDAKKDKDNIIAVIKGYATNNDGNRKIGYTAPSVVGQKECIVGAQRMAGITSDMVSYVECHGTGTKLGDPIEVQALKEAFECNTNKNNEQQRQCVLGAVKANIGHAGAAAGVAGLIKVCHMLQYRLIPKQINYEKPNEELHLNDTYFKIMEESQKWDKKNDLLRIAGVSSFGIGGTNAHMIVSEYIPENEINIPSVCPRVQNSANNYILPLSAKSNSSLRSYKQNFIIFLTNTTDKIKDIAHTLQSRRGRFNHRVVVVCNNIPNAIEQLQSTININKINEQKKHSIVYMFPGQGNQYPNMSLGLYQYSSKYKNTVDKCIRLVNKYLDIKFEKILFPKLFGNDVGISVINETRWAQLALFVVEYSLARLLNDLNISAVSYIGHSIGEYVAATLSGVFSLEDAIKLVVMRGQLMQLMPKGAMLSIQADANEVDAIIKNNHCEIAVINSPKNCVVSGTHEAIENLKLVLTGLGYSVVFLRVSHAYHSNLMAKASKEFIYKVKQIKLNKPQIRFISNVTGNFITDDEAISPEYWASHLRKTVLFSQGIKTLLERYSNLFFVEVGPGKSSVGFVKQHDIAKANVAQVLNSQKDNDAAIKDLNCEEHILSKMWVSGYNLDFDGYCKDFKHKEIVVLPNYCFDNGSYWVNSSPNIGVAAPQMNVLETTSTSVKNRVLEQNQPDRCYEIAKIFIDALGVEKISVYDDFFKLGGDSLLAVNVVAKLQQNYKINMDDFLKYPNVAKISEIAIFAKDNLRHKLKQVVELYARKAQCSMQDIQDMSIKQTKYLQALKQIKVKKQKKNIHCVMLTGATGHVGCNILYQLLHETSYKIYLLVRALSSKEAAEKINRKFKHYFDVDLKSYKDRIMIVVADIEQPKLGLTKTQYQKLINNVDSIIHAAALVKHYGDYTRLYRANVQATINLLELSKQTKGKDFHYISTVAVLINGHVPNRSYYTFDEDDDASILFGRDNVYARTKYEGEVIVNDYRKYGLISNIYRLGNVAMHSINRKHQENFGDNAFFVIAKTIKSLGIVANEIDEVEVSPVDLTAKAIVKLFDKTYLSNMTHHVFNPRLSNLSQLLVEAKDNTLIKVCAIDEFVDTVLKKLDTDSKMRKQVELFMLHQEWLQDINLNQLTKIKILNRKTSMLLAGVGFIWPKVTKNMMFDVKTNS